jgi:hypothetical protein
VIRSLDFSQGENRVAFKRHNTHSSEKRVLQFLKIKHRAKNILRELRTSILILSLTLVTTSVCTSCKKFIEVESPVTSTNSGNVYTDDGTAASVLTGIYARISSTDVELAYNSGITSVSLFTSLSSDELTLYDISSENLSPYYRNELDKLTISGNFWRSFYGIIFIANSAIEGIGNSSQLSNNVRNQLLGEAKFIRAFCYFYLVNLYGDVPLILGTDWKVNATSKRVNKEEVFNQIISDLIESKHLLSNDYLKADITSSYNISSAERVRPTKWAASALLSRTYIYARKFIEAEGEATNVIDNTSFFSLTTPNQTFLKNSREAIWQLQPVGVGANTGDGFLFVLPSEGPNTSDYPVYLSNNVINSFEGTDLRKTSWIGSVEANNMSYAYANKYKMGRGASSVSEYIMALRLGEQYLIRAEARAQQNKLPESQNDLNAIRKRAGLSEIYPADKEALLTAIMHERQVELFTEWGHRWFDLRRTGKIDNVMDGIAMQKGGSWSSYKAYFPILQSEINANSSLIQNFGY